MHIDSRSLGESSCISKSARFLKGEEGEVARLAFFFSPRLGVSKFVSEFARDLRLARSVPDAVRNAGSINDIDRLLLMLPGRLFSMLAR